MGSCSTVSCNHYERSNLGLVVLRFLLRYSLRFLIGLLDLTPDFLKYFHSCLSNHPKLFYVFSCGTYYEKSDLYDAISYERFIYYDFDLFSFDFKLSLLDYFMYCYTTYIRDRVLFGSISDSISVIFRFLNVLYPWSPFQTENSWLYHSYAFAPFFI